MDNRTYFPGSNNHGTQVGNNSGTINYHLVSTSNENNFPHASKRCLQSLAYPEMGHRRHDTKRAHANTCDWITCHQSYTTWLKEGSGILWIKGKPGSGKSTLMEYLLRDFEKQARHQKSIQLSFFLHGRGTTLQKSRLGMFRSLLHQLLLRAPATGAAFQRSFEEKLHSQGEPGKDWEWHINEIYGFFISAVEDAATIQSVNIFVDALDEADDGTDDRDTSYQIVVDFHKINDILCSKKLRSTICFSCRHFPVITKNQRWEIWVEKENHEDISTYIRDELEKRLSPAEAESRYLIEWQDSIIEGAQGVFQWATLVAGMVGRYLNNGKSAEEIKQILAKVPKQLGDVYKHILEQVIEKEEYQQTLRLMRWVCLAERPLTLVEICFAMNLPDTETFDSELDELELATHDTMRKRVVSLSGGLIEFKQHERQQILQFIHQSVNDFLLRDGLEFLDTMSHGNPIGLGHHQLSVICANYIGMIKIDYSKEPDEEAIQAQFLFVDYAVRSWYLHAEKAETQGIPQDYLLQFIQHHPYAIKNWIWLYKIIDPYNISGRRPEHNSTLLHITSGANLLSVVNGLLKKSYKLELMDNDGNRALHYASRRGYVQIVKTLLAAGALINEENKSKSTVLELAAANGHREVVEILLAKGANVNKQTGNTGNALYGAALKGSRAVVRMLLDHKADVNAQGGEYGNALYAAVSQGHQPIVQLFLDHKADVNAQGGNFGNALQAAVFQGHQPIVQLLLDHKADVNTQGGEYGNALQAAVSQAREGHQSIVQLLLDHKANVNAQGGRYGNALYAAVSQGHQPIVQLLLDYKADVNAQGGYFGNALQAAAYRGHRWIMQLLLIVEPKLHLLHPNFLPINPLQIQNISTKVQSLLDRGLEIKDFHNNVEFGNQTAIISALDNGMKTDVPGGYHIYALHTSASRWNLAIVSLLVERSSAELNFKDQLGRTPLWLAASRGYVEIVEYLLKHKADPSISDNDGKTPLIIALQKKRNLVVEVIRKHQGRLKS
ncbi:ankyrin repeat-containing protein [Rutstroemia sp. NJR-2017a WRK4]|nr:ankyrin repeat-containing protein [Rutstroemia sp. NJR-2017a WRK4]